MPQETFKFVDDKEETFQFVDDKKKKRDKIPLFAPRGDIPATPRILSKDTASTVGGIIKDTLSGTAKDIGRQFTRKNPLLAPVIDELSQDPTKIITSVPEAILHGATAIPASAIGIAQQVGQAIPKVMAGRNVLEAVGSGKEESEKLSSKLTYKPKTKTAEAMVTAAFPPALAVDEMLGEAARMVTKDETKQAGIQGIGRAAGLLALYKANKMLESRAVSKKVLDNQLRRYKELRETPPSGYEYKPNINKPRGEEWADDFGAVYGEGGSIIGGVKQAAQIKPVVGASTEKSPIPFRLVEQNIKRINPDLHRRTKNYLFEKDSNSGKSMYVLGQVDRLMGHAWEDVLKGKNHQQKDSFIHARIADIVEGRVKPENALEEVAVNNYRKIMGDIVEEINRLTTEQGERFTVRGPWGERAWSPVEGYYPRVYSNLKELIESKSKHGMRAREIIGNNLAKRMYPQEYANTNTRAQAVENAMAVVRSFTSKSATKRYGHLESSRLFRPEDVAELEAAGILKREYGSHIIADYLQKTHDRLSWTRNFGSDILWNGQKVPRAWAEALSKTENPTSRDYLSLVLERATGNVRQTSWTKVSNYLNTIQSPKMILSSAANMNQWLANTVPVQAIRDVPKTVMDIARNKMGDESVSEFYRKAGIQITPERVIDKIGDDPNFMAKANRIFYKLIGFSQTEGINAAYGGVAGARSTARISAKLALRPEAYRAGAWEQQLRKMGLDSLTISEIKAGKLLGREHIDQLYRSAWEIKRLTQFTNDLFGKPLSFSNPNARLLTKFKNFPISQLQSFAVEGLIKPAVEFAASAGKRGDIMPLLKAPIAMGIAGALTTGVKTLVWSALGKKDLYTKYLKDKPFLSQWAYFITQAGALGIASDLVTATSADKLITNIGGATFSDAVKIAEAFYAVRQDVAQSFKVKNPKLIVDRRAKIAKAMAKLASDTQPLARMAITRFWPEYVAAKDFASWEFMYTRASTTYKDLLEYNPDAAEEFWEKFLNTWGEEYQEVVGHLPEKPTLEETARYQEGKKNPWVKR